MILQTYAFGTMVMLNIGNDIGKEDIGNEILEAVTGRLGEMDNEMSYFKHGSDISRINANAGLKAQRVSRDTLDVVENALVYSRLSNGALDLTVRPLLDLWRIGKECGHIPEADKICHAREYADYRCIELDRVNGTVRLGLIGQAIDVNCIAKGYAADVTAEILVRNGIESGLINLGGNIYACGRKPDGLEWRIGVQNPGGIRGQYAGYFDIHDCSAVTSGNYERYFIANGKKYHHIINPATGYPAENGIASVTVLSPYSVDGDALTTCIFVLGIEKGLELAGKIEAADVLIITEDKKLYGTPGCRERFIITDKEFIWV